MNQELELTHVFLRHAHPEDEGWVMSRNIKLYESTVEYSFRNEHTLTLVITHTQDPFASKEHLRQAMEVQTAYATENIDVEVKVLLIYGPLLMNPHDLPKNISVVSVTEEGTGTNDLSSN